MKDAVARYPVEAFDKLGRSIPCMREKRLQANKYSTRFVNVVMEAAKMKQADKEKSPDAASVVGQG